MDKLQKQIWLFLFRHLHESYKIITQYVFTGNYMSQREGCLSLWMEQMKQPHSQQTYSYLRNARLCSVSTMNTHHSLASLLYTFLISAWLACLDTPRTL